jgi:hypothetical protein
MRRVLALAEGQTEERFIKTVLAPHLQPFGLDIIPKVLLTKKVKAGPDFKGGVTSYHQVTRDLRLLLRDTNAICVTTLIDLYGVPADWPSADVSRRGVERALLLEAALRRDLEDARLLPFLMVHEFEAILYCEPEQTARALQAPLAVAAALAETKSRYGSPEDINDGKTTHPSARIAAHWPSYRKVLHGPNVAARIGIRCLRDACPHFAEWLSKLEKLGAGSTSR